MKYKLLLLTLLFVTSCGTPNTTDTSSPIMEIKNTSTPYVNSTSTLNYQATIDVVGTEAGYARQTSEAAFEIGIQATNDHEARVQELARIAQDNVLLTNQANIWTVTAAGTSIALTQTQQPILNTQIAGVQTVQAGMMTMAKEQPTQIVAITNANNSNKTWWVEFAVRMFMFISMGFFMIGVGRFAINYNRPLANKELIKVPDNMPDLIPIDYYGDKLPKDNSEEEAKQEEVQQEAVAVVSGGANTSYPSKMMYKFPCTPEQLDELANKTIIQGLSLAYDNFAGKGSLFTRETYAPVYSFMLRHRLAMSTGIKLDGKNKGIILTGKEIGEVNGQDVLAQWLASRTLPGSFTVEDPKPLPSSVHTPATPLPVPSNVPHIQEIVSMLREEGRGSTPVLRDLNNE